MAFRIMSKTYGAQKRDTGEGLNDSCRLDDLVKLLFFEDLEEATNACKHYNIKVDKVSLSPSPAVRATAMTWTADPNNKEVDMILWKTTEFKESLCPKRSDRLPLAPLKMKRTIESKVNSVTRLGVCRGQISGLGDTLAERELKRTLSRSRSTARRDEKEHMSKERILRRIEEKKERERLRME